MVFVHLSGIPAAAGNFVLPVLGRRTSPSRLNLASSFHLGDRRGLLPDHAGDGRPRYRHGRSTPLTWLPQARHGIDLGGRSPERSSSVFGWMLRELNHRDDPRAALRRMRWFVPLLAVGGLRRTSFAQVLDRSSASRCSWRLSNTHAHRRVRSGLWQRPVVTRCSGASSVPAHPAVYIMTILPAMGVISEVFATFQPPHLSRSAFLYSNIAMPCCSALPGLGHHMFTSGQSASAALIFSATFVAIPSAIRSSTARPSIAGRSAWETLLMLYEPEVLVLVRDRRSDEACSSAPCRCDVRLHVRTSSWPHFHYVMMGSALIAFLAGVHYWWPKMFGRMYSEFTERSAPPGVHRLQQRRSSAVRDGAPGHAASVLPRSRVLASTAASTVGR